MKKEVATYLLLLAEREMRNRSRMAERVEMNRAARLPTERDELCPLAVEVGATWTDYFQKWDNETSILQAARAELMVIVFQ